MLLIFWPATKLNMAFVCMGVVVLIGIIFRLDDDRPACGEYTTMRIEILRFEEVATEYRIDGQVLPIWQTYDDWRWPYVGSFRASIHIKNAHGAEYKDVLSSMKAVPLSEPCCKENACRSLRIATLDIFILVVAPAECVRS